MAPFALFGGSDLFRLALLGLAGLGLGGVVSTCDGSGSAGLG